MEHATPQGGSGFREGFLRHGITRSNKAGVGISYWNLMMKFRSDESAGEVSSNEDGYPQVNCHSSNRREFAMGQADR